jgi:hypothetical protein
LNRLKVFEGIPPPYDRVIGIMDTVEALWAVLFVTAAKADGSSSSTESVEAETRKKGKYDDLYVESVVQATGFCSSVWWVACHTRLAGNIRYRNLESVGNRLIT